MPDPYSNLGDSFTFQNDTIADNIADTNTTGIGAGLQFSATGATTLKDTMVAGNLAGPTGSQVAADFGMDSSDYVNGLTATYNLVGLDRSGLIPTGTSYHNLVSTDSAHPIDPGLAPLGDYGGPTQTQALLDNSPAIDAGDPNFNSTTLPYDQRGAGFNRIVDGNGDGTAQVDMGAFETFDVDPASHALTVYLHPGAAVTITDQQVSFGTTSLSLAGVATSEFSRQRWNLRDFAIKYDAVVAWQHRHQ